MYLDPLVQPPYNFKQKLMLLLKNVHSYNLKILVMMIRAIGK